MNTLNKIVHFFKENKYFTALLIFVGTFLMFTIWQFSDIGFLGLHSVDEFAFQGSIGHMLESFLTGNFSGIFGFGFYQYGFIYFLLNAIAAAPGILNDNYTWAIVSPRLVTSVFAIGSLIYIYMFVRIYVTEITATLIATIFVTMPAFWYNATWFHPDWPMTFFLVAFIYYLAKDNWTFGKYFKFAVVAFGLALAFKYQAITSIPLLALYIFYNHFRTLTTVNFWLSTKRLIVAIFTALLIFLFCNPYIIHPMGWSAFVTAFKVNMTSNATNHGAALSVNFVTKINLAVGDFYLNIIFLFIFFIGSLWLFWIYFKKSERNLFAIIAINFLINFGYLVFFVNKAWQVYYLPVVITGLLSLVYYLSQIKPKQQNLLILLVCLAQIAVYMHDYIPILKTSRDISNAPYFNTYTQSENIKLNEFLVTNLSNKINPDTHILLSDFTPFSFDSIGLKLNQVNIIFGPLNRSSLDANEYLKGQKNYWGDLKTEAELLASFSPASIIIIRKNIPFYTNTGLEVVRNKTAYSEAHKIVLELYNGKLGYDVLAENELVVIFKKT